MIQKTLAILATAGTLALAAATHAQAQSTTVASGTFPETNQVTPLTVVYTAPSNIPVDGALYVATITLMVHSPIVGKFSPFLEWSWQDLVGTHYDGPATPNNYAWYTAGEFTDMETVPFTLTPGGSFSLGINGGAGPSGDWYLLGWNIQQLHQLAENCCFN
jgi:hypothetical protein